MRWGGMRPLLALILVLPLVSVPAVRGQDFFEPLQEAIESLTRPDAPVAAPEPPPPPEPRPEPEAAPPEEDVPLPRPRPEAEEPEPEEPAAEVDAPEAAEAEPEEAEADRVYQAACPAVLNGLVEAEMLPPLSEGACGERSPLSVTAVMSHGRMVPLSTPLVTNCQMASALPDWVASVDAYAMATRNARIERLETGTSYMCRNRNNADEGLTSEHGFANAADITGFTLDDGETVTVEGDWLPAGAPDGRFLRFAHDAACTGFTTVLGPEANELHEDHFHLDLGCHGRSCTARLCE